MPNSVYALYLIGFLPSFIWLLFYLKKDKHPESNRMVIKIFIYGMVAAVAAILLEKQYQNTVHSYLNANGIKTAALLLILSGAIIEETVKYAAVWLGALRNQELDEPLDVMLYLIISALGFAALENILVLARFSPLLSGSKALEVSFWRFISATFLHALCSGTLGYWVAISFCRRKLKWLYALIGLGISIGLHGVYNWSIMEMSGAEKLLLPIIILIALGCLAGYWFKKLKKLKSVCLIKP